MKYLNFWKCWETRNLGQQIRHQEKSRIPDHSWQWSKISKNIRFKSEIFLILRTEPIFEKTHFYICSLKHLLAWNSFSFKTPPQYIQIAWIKTIHSIDLIDYCLLGRNMCEYDFFHSFFSLVNWCAIKKRHWCYFNKWF